MTFLTFTKKSTFIFLFFLLFSLISTKQAFAATFTVTKTADTNDGTCDSDCSLREAVIAANTNSGSDTIDLPAGTYLLDLTGRFENAAATGDLDILDSVEVDGAGTSTTIIDGNFTDRIFDLPTGSFSFTIRNMTIKNGTGDIQNGDGAGAGIRRETSGSNFLVDHVLFSNNITAVGSGGAIYSTDSFTVTDSSFVGNKSASGGAISGNNVHILNSTFENNEVTSDNGGGGAVDLGDNNSTIFNSTFYGNKAHQRGGAIVGSPTISHSTIAYNHLQGSVSSPSNKRGAGISMGTGSIDNSIVTDNTIIDGNGFHTQSNCVPLGDSPSATSNGYNLLGPTTNFAGCIRFGGSTDINDKYSKFDPDGLKDNGGPTKTLAIMSNSQAIDAGDPSCSSTDLDQRGVARGIDSNANGVARCDIGAFEAPEVTNALPLAKDDLNNNTYQGVEVNIPVLDNDSDANNALDPESITIVSQSDSQATITPNPDGTITYLSDSAGPANFVYQVCDVLNACDKASAIFSVIQINPLTITPPSPITTNEGDNVQITLSVNVSGGIPSYTYAWDLDENGSFESNEENPIFIPYDGPSSHSIPVKVTDSRGVFTTGSVEITVLNSSPNAQLQSLASGPITAGSSAVIQFINQSDVSSADVNAGFTYQYDCHGDGVFEVINVTQDSHECFYPVPGFFSARARILDKDGGGRLRSVGVEVIADEPSVDDFVVFGTDGIWFKSGGTVHSGDVGVNSASSGPYLDGGVEASIGQDVQFATSSSKLFADSVRLRSGSSVYDVHYNDITGPGTILGQSFNSLSLPVIPSLPTVPTFSAGSTNILVPHDTTQTLTAGSYGSLTVKTNATVTFSGGVYTFDSWAISSGAKLYFSAPTEIRIVNKIDTAQNVEVKPATGSGIDASDIKIFITGINGSSGAIGATPKAADFGGFNTIEANIFVPNGTLNMVNQTQATGAFIGKWVVVGQDVEVTRNNGF